ncbi:hypothetical protein [Nocardioides sp. B-3]|nr:hypothetical protein [Nocardioides sp. B-3]
MTYSISTPELRDLLLAARSIPAGLVHVQDDGDAPVPGTRTQ